MTDGASWFGNLFGHQGRTDTPELLSAVERAVIAVEPLLLQVSGYPDRYREPAAVALEYARHLAASVPGPVAVDRESYAGDPLVHALFPDIDFVDEAICSSLALQGYLREFPASRELYALMGMRRFEKSVVGMELSGDVVQHDVAQKAIYFTGHTIANPAPGEEQARELVAMSFFDSLVDKVKRRIEQRKQDKQVQMLEKDMLMERLRTANDLERHALEDELVEKLDSLQTAVSSLDLRHYAADFEAVLLHPEEHLRLDKIPIVMDSMGIRRAEDDAGKSNVILFDDLIGFDRRDWTVTMVHCGNLRNVSFAEKLDKAYRRLVV